jgi:polysaccharide deacetylase family protein (PEP-CTERM system associated)
VFRVFRGLIDFDSLCIIMTAILSFDVEEHDRIEAASGLSVSPRLKAHYRERVDWSTRRLLDLLAERAIKATFFVVGQIARDNPGLVQAISDGGHEVANHSWDHQRIHRHTPASFREDLRISKDALEQAAGSAVVGFRAPTFSVMRETAWALDILVESGYLYDSSIYPVRHDRYGIPDAPREPFWAKGKNHEILEIPPLTWRVMGMNVPVGGGGYFRLFPLWMIRQGIRQMHQSASSGLAMLYFHPWEFDPNQERLPLGKLGRFRTYVGVSKSMDRLRSLLEGQTFVRACDIAGELEFCQKVKASMGLAA